jgi:hypothetical protein
MKNRLPTEDGVQNDNPSPLIPSSSQPVPIAVAYDGPEAGWIRIVVTCGSQVSKFSASQCFDPIQGLIEWLAAISAGEQSWVSINPEGWWVDLIAESTASPEILHLTAQARWYEEQEKLEVEIDAIVRRRDLVAAFYYPLVALWKPIDDNEFWREWDYTWDPDEEPVGRYEVRNAAIEAFLAV